MSWWISDGHFNSISYWYMSQIKVLAGLSSNDQGGVVTYMCAGSHVVSSFIILSTTFYYDKFQETAYHLLIQLFTPRSAQDGNLQAD